MAWIKLDDGFFFHPKARAVGRDGQVLYLASLCWSASSETEGLIYKRDLPLLATVAGVKPATSLRLVDAGLWEPHPEGWLIHDYLDYNPSAETLRELRQKRSEAGRRGGQRSKPPGSKSEANEKQTGKQNGEPNGTPYPYPFINKGCSRTEEVIHSLWTKPLRVVAS